MTTKFDELVAKLKEIFQIDKPELDFGIYKILHARAAEINDFLEHKLKTKVEELLKSHGQQDTKSTLDAAKSELIQNVGVDALETDGSVKQQYKAMPMPAVRNAVEKYEAALSAYQTAADSLKNETEVYSRLLDFFKRYYEEGDFISKRRYKDGVYAIPYSGEEVKLHWANADQYYTKSGENFTNYRFTLEGGLKVEFKLISAETGKDNVKDNEAVRRFVLWNPETVADIELTEDGPEFPSKAVEEKDGTLEIYFQYLKIPKPKKGDAKKVTQESFVEEAEKAIRAAIIADNALKTKYQSLLAQVSQDDKRTRLRKHLADYTAKNTSDYFIHKDLKGFLERELDYYVKTEMFRLDRIDEAATIKDIEAYLHVIQAFRSIALVLIGFMAQLEDFQKKLWLKKKFVVQCDYCITMDLLPEELRAEVLSNKEQLEEWERLGFGGMNLAAKNAKDAKGRQDSLFKTGLTGLIGFGDNLVNPVNPVKETSYPDARMVDTKFYDETFKARLLRSIPDLDERCDGLLIHSENFGALNLLQERYREHVKCIYIDPPYNTGGDGFLYRDGYKDSSWLSMMDSVTRMSLPLTRRDVVLFTSLDYNENFNYRTFLSSCHGYYEFIGEIHWESKTKSQNTETSFNKLQPKVEIIFVHSRITGRRFNLIGKGQKEYPLSDERGKYREHVMELMNAGGIRGRGSMIYPITDGVSTVSPPAGKQWKLGQAQVATFAAAGDIVIRGQKVIVKMRPEYERTEKTEPFWGFFDKGIGTTESAKGMLGEILPDNKFDTVKPTEMIARLVYHGADFGDTILDYFGGSGTTAHAVIDLNRQDGGKRKYILVEMGDHFDTVLMPRIKKVVYSPEWKDGKPKVYEKGISHCFKYMTLESYEDALNNIELKRTADQESMLPGLNDDKYLLKYFLDVESRGSIISTDDFQKPFDYELKIAYESSGAAKPQKIDLVETFNYLIGLKVDSYVRRIDKGYCYLDGVLPSGEHALVFWRDCDKLDAKKLNDELEKLGVDAAAKKATFDVIYVNGDHAVQNGKIKPAEGLAQLKVRQIEAEFLEKMFACEEV